MYLQIRPVDSYCNVDVIQAFLTTGFDGLMERLETYARRVSEWSTGTDLVCVEFREHAFTGYVDTEGERGRPEAPWTLSEKSAPGVMSQLLHPRIVVYRKTGLMCLTWHTPAGDREYSEIFDVQDVKQRLEAELAKLWTPTKEGV